MVRPKSNGNGNFTAHSLVVGDSKRTMRNKILLGLPTKERDAVFSKLEFISLPTPMVLNEADAHIKSVFFINGGLASVLKVMEDGRSIEVGLCGKDSSAFLYSRDSAPALRASSCKSQAAALG